MSFKKDVFAIFLGGFFGVLLAYSAGSFWLAGLLAGGAIGYIARMLAEPARIASAIADAWEVVIEWRPASDWKERVGFGLDSGIGIGGVLGVFSGIIAIIQPEAFSAFHGDWLSRYLIMLAVCSVVTSLFVVPIVYFCGMNSSDDISFYHFLGKHFNMFAIHYNAVKYVLVGIWLGLIRLPYGIVKFLQFVKYFVIFAHSENFTACGIYAMVSATTIFLYVPNNILAMLVAAFLGAIAGAIMRRVVLHILAEESA